MLDYNLPINQVEQFPFEAQIPHYGIEEVYAPTEICFPAQAVLNSGLEILGMTTISPDNIRALLVRDRLHTYAVLQAHPHLQGMLCILRIIHTNF